MGPAAAGESGAGSRAGERSWNTIPLGRLLLYYAGLLLVGGGLVAFVPGARAALVAPAAAPLVRDVDALLGGAPEPPGAAATWPGAGARGTLALAAVAGALVLALPVAWVYRLTRGEPGEATLVHAVIVLPMVVAGVVLVVRNSLALAFALAGIVAGVRFRQKLNEPQDAVYVLLALGIGLAAGVQALDVALVVSLSFNAVVLALWRYDRAGP